MAVLRKPSNSLIKSGGGGSHERTCLRPISLITPDLQGIFLNKQETRVSALRITAWCQAVTNKFPKSRNREFERPNREFIGSIREFSLIQNNVPSLGLTKERILCEFIFRTEQLIEPAIKRMRGWEY